MKRFIKILCVLVLFVLSTQFVSAQAYQIYVSDINLTSQEYSVGGVVEGNFKLSNLSDIPQTDIYYNISAGNYSKETLTFSNIQGQSEKSGPYYVKAQAQDQISFKYTLPSSITGDSAIKITATLKDGTFVGEAEYPISIIGDAKIEILSVLDSALTISDYEAVINPQTGPTVYDGEKIDLTYSVSSSNVAMTLTPVLKLYDRVDNPDTLKKVVEFEKIKVDDEVNTHTISLPTDLDPLVYYGVLSFQDSNNKELFSTTLRYIIAGPIATVRNITTETLSVKKGDEFSAVVSYGGEPFDEYRPEKQIQLASSTITVTAKNEKGEEVATVSQLINLKASNKVLTIPMKAQTKAESLSFYSVIKTSDGKVLDEYTTVLPTEDAVRHQKSLITDTYGLKVAIVSVVLILLLILAVLFIKKKYSKINIPTVVFLILVVSGISIFSLTKTNATSLPSEAYDYLSGVTDWDNKFLNIIMGWKVIQTERTIYSEGEDTGDTVFNSEDDWGFDSFQITAVTSPYPPNIKIYEPGEKFKLSVNAVYGDCNNNPRHYSAYSYDPNTKWWNNKPKLKGEIADRVAYWSQEGLGAVLFDYQGGKEFSDWKYLFKKTDLQAILPDISEKKEIALKDIVSKSVLDFDYGGICGHGWCAGDGFTAKLYRFAEDGDATTGDYVNWIKNNYTKVDSVQKTFLNQTNYLDEYPAVSKFDFTNTSNLKKGGNEFTDQYIKMLKILNNRVYDYTKKPLGDFLEWFHKSEHSAELTAVTLNKTYSAPQEPGYHKVYFYLYQYGNSGERDITAVQVICVRGKGVCPNEKTNTAPVVAITNVSEIKNTQAKLNWSYSDKQGDKQIQYNIQISTQKGFTDTSKIVDIWSGIGDSPQNNNIRSKVLTNLKANTTYYVKMRAKSDADTDPRWSNWTDGNYSFTTTKSGCTDEYYEGEFAGCINKKENEWYCDVDTWKKRENGKTCDDTNSQVFSCSVNPSSAKINESVRYIATTIPSASYQWFKDSAKTQPISDETTNIYQTSYSAEGQYTRYVEVRYSDETTNNDVVKTAICTASVSNDSTCGNKPSNRVCSAGVTTSRTYTTCNQSTGDWNFTESSCSTSNETDANVKDFYFNPDTISSGEYCGLHLEVENTTGCKLVNRFGVEKQYTATPDFKISVNSNDYSVGTYSLLCSGIGDAYVTPTKKAVKSCYSKPDVQEN